MSGDNYYRKLYDNYRHVGFGVINIPPFDAPTVVAALKFAADAYDVKQGWFEIESIKRPDDEILTVRDHPF